MVVGLSVPSASQTQNHSHDQQEHEDQATGYWQEGKTKEPHGGNITEWLVH